MALLLVPAVGALLWARYRERGVWVAKPLASALFLAVALLEPALDPRYGWAVFAGLVLSFAGDVLLIPEDRRALAAGVVAFLLGHVAYVFAAWPRLGFTWPGGLAAVLAFASGLAVWWRVRLRMGRLAWPGLVYTAALASTCAAALLAWLAAPEVPGRALLGLGGALFYASDVAVVRQRFVTPSFVNRAWGLPCYYAAQACLALSIARMPPPA